MYIHLTSLRVIDTGVIDTGLATGAVREARDQGYTGPEARGGGGSGSDYARGATYAEYLGYDDARSMS